MQSIKKDAHNVENGKKLLCGKRSEDENAVYF